EGSRSGIIAAGISRKKVKVPARELIVLSNQDSEPAWAPHASYRRGPRMISVRRSRRLRGLLGRVVMIGLAALALGATAAFKMLFPHSGERAMDLVPDDAAFV